jgi:hypothetical protein
LEAALADARARWNSGPGAHGVIHNWSGLIRSDDRTFWMAIDFGSTDHSALEYWLTMLDAALGGRAVPDEVIVRTPASKI